MKIKWLSVASFEIEDKGHHIVTDPFITVNSDSPCTWEDVEGCDLITLSHAHYDHISDIPKLSEKFNPLILCGERTALPLAQWVNCNPMNVYSMYPELELDFDWVKVKALYGIHLNLPGTNADIENRETEHAQLPDLTGSKELQVVGNIEYRNYLFTFPDGRRVLIWGNLFTPVQKNMLRGLNPDLAIIQATVQARDPEAYAEFVEIIGAKKVIPHHMDLHAGKDKWLPRTEAVKAAVEKRCGIEFIIPEHNQWIELE